jgi:hypothetical protein
MRILSNSKNYIDPIRTKKHESGDDEVSYSCLDMTAGTSVMMWELNRRVDVILIRMPNLAICDHHRCGYGAIWCTQSRLQPADH